MGKSNEASKTRVTTATEIAELARRYLEPQQPKDYRLEVMPDGIKQDDDWWYVLVRPDREDIRSYDYYGRLAEAEVNLRDEQNLNVLLVPVLPE